MEEIEVRYVSKTVAELLRNANFDVITRHFYSRDSDEVHEGASQANWNGFEHSYSAPTQQIAIDWFESNGFIIETGYQVDLNGNPHWSWCILNKKAQTFVLRGTYFEDTRQEAIDMAMKYILTKLMKVVSHEITERYVSPKVAELLKEKNFNKVCRCVYRIDDNGKATFMDVEEIPGWENFRGAMNEQLPKGYISAPTQAMAREWIEDVHKLFIEVRCGCDLDDAYHWTGTAWFDFDLLPIGKEAIIVPETDGIATWNKSWEAVDAALQYILTKLI